MRLPAPSSEYRAFVRYGRYVSRRLRRAGFEVLAKDAEKTTQQVKITGRAWEDADEPIQDAMADRDAADDDLDLSAQRLRMALAGRTLGAERQEPYTLIFPQGIGYYTAAPLDEEEARYGELRLRVQQHLPADDDAGVNAIKAIDSGLATFKSSVEALRDAQAKEALARTSARSAIAAFERQMEKTYGVLLVEVGKTQAERFFPKIRSGRSSQDEGETPPNPPAA